MEVLAGVDCRGLRFLPALVPNIGFGVYNKFNHFSLPDFYFFVLFFASLFFLLFFFGGSALALTLWLFGVSAD